MHRRLFIIKSIVMPKKLYVSGTIISLSVLMPSGRSRRVSFDVNSSGGSTFATDDAELQAAIEKHSRFGKSFRVEEVVEPVIVLTPKKVEKPSVRVIEVSNLSDAKEMLVDMFGLSRTKLRTKADIFSAAAERGIEFKGL
jgi:hypothetical protein